MALLKARKKELTHKPTFLANGDTKKKLLSQSRFALFKHYSKWTETQRSRTEILFDLYLDLEED